MHKGTAALLGTLLLLGSIGAYASLTWYRIQEMPTEEAVPAEQVATTTEEAVTPTTTPAATKQPTKPTTTQPSAPTYTAPAPTYTPPPVIINNTNVQNNPPQESNQPTTSAPPFVEPAPMTNLEIALDIAQLYDPNATVEPWGESSIRVHVFNGKTVTVDPIGNWEDNLKITLRKIK